MRTAAVVPVYNYFEYAQQTVRSLLVDPQVAVVVVDDCSPDRDTPAGNEFFLKYAREERVKLLRLEQNEGLNFAWNVGIKTALDCFEPFQVCVTNSDVLFPQGWLRSIEHALESGLALVGPLTNAPGTESAQQVSKYVKNFVVTDNLEYLNRVSAELCASNESSFLKSAINGFCMVARTKTWLDNKFDAEHFFRPRNEFDAFGRKNPTPLMTFNEYELQTRLWKKGLKSGIALGSFVFHYRSVSRGEQFGRGQTFRKGTLSP